MDFHSLVLEALYPFGFRSRVFLTMLVYHMSKVLSILFRKKNKL